MLSFLTGKGKTSMQTSQVYLGVYNSQLHT